MKFSRWEPGEIVVPDRLRKGIREDAVIALMDSIRQIGLREPPTIRIDKDENGGEYPVLIAGQHRVEACKRLKIERIDCVVFDGDAIDARLWEIAENLHRAELTPEERDEHILEWRRLTLGKVAAGGHLLGGSQPKEQGFRKTAADLGIGKETVREAVILSKLTDDARDAAEDADLTRKERVKVAKEPPDRQVAKVNKIAAEKKSKKKNKQVQQEEPKAERNTPRPTHEQRIEAARKYLANRLNEDEVRTFGEMLIGICDPLAHVLMRKHA
jgi:hypothetical protein